MIVTQTLLLAALIAWSWFNYQRSVDHDDKLNGRGNWMIQVVEHNKAVASDRLTASSFDEWQAEFCKKNGLETMPARKFETPDFPKAPR